MKTQRVSLGIALLFLNFATRRGCIVHTLTYSNTPALILGVLISPYPGIFSDVFFL